MAIELKRFRSPSLFFGGRKLAELQGVKYRRASGDEIQVGDGEVLGFSDGVDITDITATVVIPVSGTSVDLNGMLDRKEDVQVALGMIGTAIYQMTMRFQTVDITGNTPDGTCMGEFALKGGKPETT